MVEDPHNEREGRGRSAKKRAARAIDSLAVRMVESTEAVCRRLPVPDDLREVLDQARSITSRGARKREIKHLASLLRRDEAASEAVRAALDAVGRSNRAERDRMHQIEELRDALCDPDRFAEAIETAAARLPALDRQTLTNLARSVHTNGDKRASREIFRRLRTLMGASSDA